MGREGEGRGGAAGAGLTASGWLRGPRIFDLSPPGLGADWLARLARANRIEPFEDQPGGLAIRIEHGVARREAPALGSGNARFFTGLDCTHRYPLPPLPAWRRFRYLRRHFRQAVFLLVIRDPDEWVAARMAENGGHDARTAAIIHGTGLAELPGLWRADYVAHLAAARAFFVDDPRYVELPFPDLSFALLREALAPWYALTVPVPPPTSPDGAAEGAADGQAQAGDPDAPEPGSTPLPMPVPYPPPGRIAPPLTGAAARFADAMAAACLGTWQPDDSGSRNASRIYAFHDGAGRVLRKSGNPWPILRHPDLPGRPFLMPPGNDKADRTVGVLNECLRLGRSPVLHMDMQDARRFGAACPVGVPLLTYNRRRGAANVTLWPLPGYHTPGAPNFVHAASPDPIPWGQKADRVAWRGDLSGNVPEADGSPGTSSFDLLTRLDRMPVDDDAGLEAVMAQLARLPRLNAVRRLQGPDYDLALALTPYLQPYQDLPMLAPHVGSRQPREWFHGFRYVLSLPGYDTGSNFLMAANSGSLVMKAEDGWELFYSHLFRPWEHYVPIAVDCTDVPEKLDWARSHQAECRAMVRAAQAACAVLADTRLRAAALHLILDGLEERT